VASFALVHGAWHGAWCWDALAAELRAAGHSVSAAELPMEDLGAGCERYAELVAAACDGAEAPIVVGHSMGGLTIPLVAALRPVRMLVYLCALVPRPGRSPFALDAGEPPIQPAGFAASGRDAAGRSYWNAADSTAALYADCAPDVAAAACARLRPQAPRPSTEPCPLDALPGVAVASVIATDDAAVRPEWSRWTARRRLGVEPVELPGGHSPMLSRPAALAQALDAVSRAP
jgi:pimeloyl-ACP methyl ester carboxylesterase